MAQIRDFRFVNANSNMAITADWDPSRTVRETLAKLMLVPKLALDPTKNEFYSLAYNGSILPMDSTLDHVRAGASIDIVYDDSPMGASSRLQTDYEALVKVCSLNPKHLQMRVVERTNGDPTTFSFLLTGIAGPVVDYKQIGELRKSFVKREMPIEYDPQFLKLLRPLKNRREELVLKDTFAFQIVVNLEYPYAYGPSFFYQDDFSDRDGKNTPTWIPFHTNVRPFSKQACLFEHWEPRYTLTDCVQRFCNQIAWVGFQEAYFEDINHKIDLLNAGALEWIKKERRLYPNMLPFPTRETGGPYVLAFPRPPIIVDPERIKL